LESAWLDMDVLVLGCGVSGLTTALCLQRVGYHVRIWAKELPPDTTSNIAAAVWYPYRAYPAERVTAWGAEAYRRFMELADDPESGVIVIEVLELRAELSRDPEWAASVEGFRHARPDELPADYADGVAFRAPVIDMSVYLDYLRGVFERAGGLIERRDVATLDEAFAACPVVVNCVGLGARELLGDRDVHAARGQVIRIAHNGFRRVLLDDTGPNKVAYIVPRVHDIILGGVDDDHDERLDADAAQSASILRRCANLVERFDPAFAASLRAHLDSSASGEPAEILGTAVGLRPVRSAVRLEAERIAPDHLLLHNYGHGGAGVTLSWGCAAEVVKLLG
jgi:D-amino-acid oxidase